MMRIALEAVLADRPARSVFAHHYRTPDLPRAPGADDERLRLAAMKRQQRAQRQAKGMNHG